MDEPSIRENAVTDLHIRGFHFYEGDRKWLARGVTYGPFRPDENEHPYPPLERIRDDFSAMRELGINAVRLYTVPEESLARLAEEAGLRLFIDIPWPKHLDVYEDPAQRKLCREMVKSEIEKVRGWPNVAGVLLGNEIPSDIVRWRGNERVEEFLRDLYGLAKWTAPGLSIGFANFPSTEYLRLGFFDFLGFNIYLHDVASLYQYLTRLRNLYPEIPLVLSEFGTDTKSQGEEFQSRFLEQGLLSAYEAGLAGTFIFSWTDEWFAGGHEMTQWSFGIVDRERRPKESCESVKKVFGDGLPAEVGDEAPLVSVVVATYNGARTLEECLNSLKELRYPEYEVIVVDDGSTDETPQILERFPWVEAVRQPNLGLSAARNTGIRTARGEIVAFTDSDCYVDPDWLNHLVLTMERGDFAGVGGPNVTPEEQRPISKIIALAPGHATHVLLENGDAEHVPGCNMAFLKSVLEEIGGFDPVFRKAGDDVDVIWRLQDRGHRIGFSPGAFVWHHRRPTVKSYLRQQMGYGEAEAILHRKHPHRFNDRGQSLWRGAIYGSEETRPLFGKPNVHYGVFCSAGYQCVYEPKGGMFGFILTSLEWWGLCMCLLLVGLAVPSSFMVGGAGVLLSLGISALRAWHKIGASHERAFGRFPAVWFFWILQPVLRGTMRYWARARVEGSSPGFRKSLRSPEIRKRRGSKGHLSQYWAESGGDRLKVLRRLKDEMTNLGWIFTPNSGWERWDFSISSSWLFKINVLTAEENHGEKRRLLRFRFRLIPSSLFWLLILSSLLVILVVALQDTVFSRGVLIGFLFLQWFAYHRANRGRIAVEAITDSLVRQMGFESLDTLQKEKKKGREEIAFREASLPGRKEERREV